MNMGGWVFFRGRGRGAVRLSSNANPVEVVFINIDFAPALGGAGSQGLPGKDAGTGREGAPKWTEREALAIPVRSNGCSVRKRRF